MDDDRHDLVRLLFIAALEMIEEAHTVAVNGQSPRNQRVAFLQAARRLQKTAEALGTLSGAIQALSRDERT